MYANMLVIFPLFFFSNEDILAIWGNGQHSWNAELLCAQIARMVVVVAATFLLLWSPFYLVTFITQVQEYSFLREKNYLFTMLLTHLIGFINSAVNPFIYAMLGDKFRTAFMVRSRISLYYTVYSNRDSLWFIIRTFIYHEDSNIIQFQAIQQMDRDTDIKNRPNLNNYHI